MERRSSPFGPLIVIAGASLVLASLWLPWYELRVPDALRDAFRGFGSGAASGAPAGQDNDFGKFFEGLAAAIPDSIEVSGWQGMEQGDVALAVIASLTLLIGVAAAGILGPSVRVDAGLAGRLVALIGAAGLTVAGYHILTRPGNSFPGADDYFALRPGVWAAAFGSVLIVAGGLIGASPQHVVAGDSWTAGAATGGSMSPAGPHAAGAESWVTPAVAADQQAGITADAAPTPAYSAAPTTSTAPPGFTR